MILSSQTPGYLPYCHCDKSSHNDGSLLVCLILRHDVRGETLSQHFFVVPLLDLGGSCAFS
jgi:hypothetical protein